MLNQALAPPPHLVNITLTHTVKFTFSTAEKGVGGWRGQTYHRLDDNKASKGPPYL